MNGQLLLKSRGVFKKFLDRPTGRDRKKKPRPKEVIASLRYGAVVPDEDTLLKVVGKETIDDIRAKAALERAAQIQPQVAEVVEPRWSDPTVAGILAAQEAAKRRQEKLAKKAAQLEERLREREELAIREKWLGQETKKGPNMTVSLYKSMASGTYEVVVQTNAQSLDVFIGGLSDALHAALVHEASAPNAVDNSQALIAATLKNAFPVAFSISGYKAEKVSESKLLTCGFASPDASELLAQSKT